MVGVIGGAAEAPPALAQAREVGRLLAEAECVVVTGGLTGVMEAASEGARAAGGRVIGLLPGLDPGDANPSVEIALPTGLGEARNVVLATAAQALIAVGGAYGTLSEIAHGIRLGKPVIVLSSPWSDLPDILRADSPEDAVTLCLARLNDQVS